MKKLIGKKHERTVKTTKLINNRIVIKTRKHKELYLPSQMWRYANALFTTEQALFWGEVLEGIFEGERYGI